MAQLTEELLKRLSDAGLECLWTPGYTVPDDLEFEAPCSIKWMHVYGGLSMGAFSYAVRGSYFNVVIGRYTSIGEDVQIGRVDYLTNWLSTSPAFYLKDFVVVGDQFEKADLHHGYIPQLPPGTVLPPIKTTHIENDVYIGHGAFIRHGVRIGTGAIVAANSVVVKDVPPYAVVAGNPAVIKKYRFPEDVIAGLLATKWWQYAPWQLRGIDVTDPVKLLPVLEKFVQKLAPYEPAKRKVSEFL